MELKETIYKDRLIDLLEEISQGGFEDSIPTFIAESLKEADFKHNTKEYMLYCTANFCNNIGLSTEVNKS